VRADPAGLLLLLATTIGWGLNWPAMKLLLAELPVLSARSAGGVLGFCLLLGVARALRERLSVPRHLWPRLVLISLLNVTAWMGLATFSLLWLSAAEATIVCYTMPVWASLMAWVVWASGSARRAHGAGLRCPGWCGWCWGAASISGWPRRRAWRSGSGRRCCSRPARW